MNPTDVLRYGQRELDAVIDQYRADDWMRIALGVWTAKDLVGHLGAFEVRFLEVVQTFLDEEPATRLRFESPATFNDDQAAVRADWPADRVLAELRDAHRGVMERVDRIAADVWRQVGTIPWYGAEYALDDHLVYTQYGHKREHAPQLGAVLEQRPG